MALVSLHLIQPHLAAPILARLADTLVGAAIAHLFSFVWPHWEFSDAPGIAARLQGRLAAFAARRAGRDAPVQDYRLARKNVIEAIAALSDSAGRMSVEPMATRKGLEEMAALLMAAHGFIAQLSAARLDIRSGRPPPDAGDPAPGCRSGSRRRPGKPRAPADVPAGPLAAAALAVLEAAERSGGRRIELAEPSDQGCRGERRTPKWSRARVKLAAIPHKKAVACMRITSSLERPSARGTRGRTGR